jgi:hypothetical protein
MVWVIMLNLINELWNMDLGLVTSVVSNMVIRNLIGWKVWLRLVCAMVWWIFMEVHDLVVAGFGLVLVPVGF